MHELSGKKANEFFIIQKSLAIAEAIINTAIGVSKALADRVEGNIDAKLTAREWVMPVSSTDKYGPYAMTAIQKGLIDREALNSVISGGKNPTAHFADGGPVGYTVNQPIRIGASNNKTEYHAPLNVTVN